MICPHCGNETEQHEDIPCKAILHDMNNILGINLRGGEAFNKLVRARWKEGFRRADFQTVCINMKREWGTDPKMCIYLRPVTLFGTKMDSYLNRVQPVIPTTNNGLGEGMVW